MKNRPQPAPHTNRTRMMNDKDANKDRLFIHTEDILACKQAQIPSFPDRNTDTAKKTTEFPTASTSPISSAEDCAGPTIARGNVQLRSPQDGTAAVGIADGDWQGRERECRFRPTGARGRLV
ncbi:hypothetical protein HO173_012119 [Letharia columbiana]|uniref:Uncharacterized protein n=1 Tax=Letharia columbiana TaxID=112416 RepID=A0A8H6CQ78_9LECA|nr:uncharacterized protein HO173_012119 [Letharia columbiana]KAF6227590.1 hypothetical protein HO173_012119 [Letharia columbiana]